jgi:hypothetical protein
MKYWEHSTESQLLELSEPFLGTWPTSGTMLDGQVYELVMQERHIKDSESLSLPNLRTPLASDSEGGHRRKDPTKNRSLTSQVRDDLLRTPTATQGQGGALGEAEARRRGNTVGIRDQAMDLAKLQGHKVSREVNNLPTPKQVAAGAFKSRIEDQVKLFPTLRASDSYERRNQKTMDRIARDGGDMTMTTLARTTTEWGKFEPAIRRWEAIIGRPAPEPTKPDGKEGNHRLSSKFTEWMMGLPDGWITDIGLKRNDELKACGNGVVPQQAELALSLLGIKEILEAKLPERKET